MVKHPFFFQSCHVGVQKTGDVSGPDGERNGRGMQEQWLDLFADSLFCFVCVCDLFEQILSHIQDEVICF